MTWMRLWNLYVVVWWIGIPIVIVATLSSLKWTPKTFWRNLRTALWKGYTWDPLFPSRSEEDVEEEERAKRKARLARRRPGQLADFE